MSTTTTYMAWDAAGVEPDVPDEADQIRQIEATMNKMQEHNFAHHRHGFRGTHVKTQAVVKGGMIVLADLPPHLAQGIFSKGDKQYPLAIRFANEPSFLQDDRVPGPRGCGMKVFGVDGPGPFLGDGGRETRTQDFTFNNSPVLELRDLPTTREIVEIRERNFDDGEGLKRELEGREDKELQFAPQGLPNRHFLSYTMYSQSAYRYGDHIAKYALFPTTQLQQDLASGAQISDTSDRDQHSRWLREYFATHDAEFDFRIQLCRDLEAQSVEDCSKAWDEERYPFETVARVVLPKGQDVMGAERRTFWEESMKLNVWEGLEVHRPLGSVNRLRKGVYAASVRKREEVNARRTRGVGSVDEIP